MCVTSCKKADVGQYLELLFKKEKDGAEGDSSLLEILSSDSTIHNRALEHVAGKMARGEDLTKAELAFRVSNPGIYILFTRYKSG